MAIQSEHGDIKDVQGEHYNSGSGYTVIIMQVYCT